MQNVAKIQLREGVFVQLEAHGGDHCVAGAAQVELPLGQHEEVHRLRPVPRVVQDLVVLRLQRGRSEGEESNKGKRGCA